MLNCHNKDWKTGL